MINEVSPIYVSFAIPEARLSDLKRYMALGSLRVEASPPEEGSATSNGRITFVDNAVDPTTGTIKIKAEFSNGDRRLWPGQFVNVVGAVGYRYGGNRCAFTGDSDVAARSIRVRRQARQDGRVPCRRGRAIRRHRDGDQELGCRPARRS